MANTTISRRTFLAACGAGAAATLAGCGGGGSNLPDWSNLDKVLADAVARQDVPFAVAMVGDRAGVLWQGAAGQASPTLKAGPEVVFHIFSMTKGIGSLAAMIMLDRGKLSLDTTVVSMLPEFAQIRVLDSIDPSGPVYRPPVRPVTLRHLLTHTSGLAYNSWNSKENDWEIATSAPSVLAGTLKSISHPLMFDPGDAWTYGVGLDWAGLMVARADGRTIDRFVQEEILDPLGMMDTVFETDSVKSRLPATKIRGADGTFSDIDLAPPPRPEIYGMGQALSSSAPDYMRFLHLVLNDGELDGRRIVSSQALALMKQNQIGNLSLPIMKTVLPAVAADVDFFPGTRKTHTAGFVRNEEDIPGMRRAGSLTWAGFLNSHFWIDPTSGIRAVLMTSSLPFAEPRFMNVYTEFERTVYRELAR